MKREAYKLDNIAFIKTIMMIVVVIHHCCFFLVGIGLLQLNQSVGAIICILLQDG